MSTQPLNSPSPAPSPAPVSHEAVMEFALKVVGDLASAMAGPLMYIGDREGLFKLLAAQPRTAAGLATAAGLQERYVREWASAMAAAGYLDYDPPTGILTLPAERAMVLANEDSPVFCGGLVQMVPDHYRVMPRVRESFHKGGGVPYSAFGDDTFEGTERLFRPGYTNFLVQQWVAAMPGVEAALKRGAKVADVGCGRGHALLTLATAFPKSTFTGYDNYAPAVEHANQLARERGLDARLRFEVRASDQLPPTGDFDLVMTCDSLHDMVSPEACARSIAAALKPDGTWFCIEPNLADRLEDNINPIGKLFYAVSTMQCMTCSLAQDGAGYGTGMGAANVRRVAAQAGMNSFTKLPIDHPFNQFFAIRR